MRWPSRWRFDALARREALALACAAMCGGSCDDTREHADGMQPVARVADLELHRRVVDFIAERDGVDLDTARARALDTLRLVAASREAARTEGGEPRPELPAARQAQLDRAARARLWLATEFEPSHGPEHIPEDDPLLQRARSTRAWVHPGVHRVCQVIVVPGGDPSADEARAIAEDPAWRDAALRLARTLHRRITHHVPVGDPHACKLLAQQAGLFGQPSDPRLKLRYENEIGYDLDACAEQADDGTCVTPSLASEWTDVVRELEPPTLAEPFATRFGAHVVLLTAVDPPRPAGDPATEAFLREQIHRRWQSEAFAELLERVRAARVVRFASDGAEP